MKSKLIKIIILFIVSLVLGTVFFSFLNKDKVDKLSLSKKVEKYNLITHKNENFNSKFFSNHPSLMFFGFLNCPDVCPFTLVKISEIINKLKDHSKLVKFYFVTVDPERDKILDLKEYLNTFNSDIIGITGSSNNIENFLKHMHVYKKKIYLDESNYTIDHSSQMLLFDKKGNFFGTLSTNEKIEDILSKIKKVINGA
ncbi:MAG: hypothetical protein CMJ06_01190 [Pelagibacterales bacterium]|nr:hypothetical protein [Pelagibacterales bacterium]OUU63479.1 MAG: hypothetical protein CBC22_01160 [Alphaproteobacteria bacterium TMED62]